MARRRNPFAAEASPALRLGFGKDHRAFRDAVAREFFDDVIGGGGFLEDADVATDDLGVAEAGEQIVRMQNVRHADEAVTQMRAGLDFVAERRGIPRCAPRRRRG